MAGLPLAENEHDSFAVIFKLISPGIALREEIHILV